MGAALLVSTAAFAWHLDLIRLGPSSRLDILRIHLVSSIMFAVTIRVLSAEAKRGIGLLFWMLTAIVSLNLVPVAIRVLAIIYQWHFGTIDIVNIVNITNIIRGNP